MQSGHKRSDDRTFRNRVLFGLAAFVVLMCGGAAIPAVGLYNRYVDYGPAAAELPAAVKAYRATGMPWTAADLNPKSPVSATENAAPFLRRAAGMTATEKWATGDKALRDAALKENWNAVAAGLIARGPAMELFEDAAKRPRADFGRNWDLGANVLFPEFIGIKEGVKSFGYRARLRAANGDLSGARTDLATMRRLARLAESDGVLISLLVRISCETIANDATVRAAALDPRLAARLLVDLKAPDPEPDFARTMRSEAYLAIATARNLKGRMRVTGSETGDENEFAKTESDPKRLLRDGLPEGKVQRAYLTRSLQIWTRAHADISRLEHDPYRLGIAMDRLEREEAEKPGLSYVMNKIIFPVFAQAGAAVPRLRAGRELTVAYLRALDERRRTGRWSDTLISGNDPFGRPYVSRREGKGFRINSLGVNGKDDGGLTAIERPTGTKSDDQAVVFPPAIGKRKP